MTDLTQVVVALQAQNILLGEILQQMRAISTPLLVYTVAGLPASAPNAVMVYASNGRNTGEGAGAGTGCVVVGNGAVWRAIWSGVAVTS